MSSAPPTPPTRSIKRVKTSKDHNDEDDEQCNSDMVSQEERLMFQAELDRLKQKIETFQQEIATRDKKIETFQQENTTLKQEKEDSSLLSILPRRNKLKSSIPNLSLRGLSNYHSCPNKKDATASEIEFTAPDLHELNDRLGLDLGKTGSALRNIIDFDDAGILTYENEYDVQEIVQCALRDAAKICNRIIVKKMSMLALTNAVNRSSSSSRSSSRRSTTTTMRTGGNTPAPRSIVLNVRRESSIFSNVVDHVVVFDELSGAPVFIVETKKGWSASPSGKDDDNDDSSRSSSTKGISRNSGTPPTAAVLGQVYDQLSEMYAKGHPNPFGAVTCFDETYITCLDNYECRDVLYNLAREEYEDSRLDRIFRNLVVVQQPATTTTTTNNDPLQDSCERTMATATSIPFFHNTQSPLQEMSAAVWNLTNEHDADPKGFTCHSNRNFFRSACFPPDHIVAAFVSAILCSLDGYRKPRAIKSFTPKQNVQLGALCMDSKSYSWGTLNTTYQGPCTYSIRKPWKLLRMITGPQPLYLVDHLGTGSTSKVYRALTGDGYDCVVKMYVKRQDDNKKILNKKDFDKNGKKAIDSEFKAYRKIYGAELHEYIWTEKLNGLHCLIHPYFKHVEKHRRRDTLPLISDRLKKLFLSKDKSKYYAFHENDQLWRHIGWFNDQLYLFDLGDLKECSSDVLDDMVQSHHDRLMSRLLSSSD